MTFNDRLSLPPITRLDLVVHTSLCSKDYKQDLHSKGILEKTTTKSDQLVEHFLYMCYGVERLYNEQK